MNVSLHDALVQGNDDQYYHFEEFFVKARNIRYVQIPDDVRRQRAFSIFLFNHILHLRWISQWPSKINSQARGPAGLT